MAHNYLICVGVKGRDKCSSLLQYRNHYGGKKFYYTGPSWKRENEQNRGKYIEIGDSYKKLIVMLYFIFFGILQ